MRTKIETFKRELADLLEKYEYEISVDYKNSDYGIVKFKYEVSGDGVVYHTLSENIYLTPEELRTST